MSILPPKNIPIATFGQGALPISSSEATHGDAEQAFFFFQLDVSEIELVNLTRKNGCNDMATIW